MTYSRTDPSSNEGKPSTIYVRFFFFFWFLMCVRLLKLNYIKVMTSSFTSEFDVTLALTPSPALRPYMPQGSRTELCAVTVTAIIQISSTTLSLERNSKGREINAFTKEYNWNVTSSEGN
jgi:hypothetical protein